MKFILNEEDAFIGYIYKITNLKEKSRQKHLGKKAYSNRILNKVIMLYPEDGEELIKNDPNWFEGNIHR